MLPTILEYLSGADISNGWYLKHDYPPEGVARAERYTLAQNITSTAVNAAALVGAFFAAGTVLTTPVAIAAGAVLMGFMLLNAARACLTKSGPVGLFNGHRGTIRKAYSIARGRGKDESVTQGIADGIWYSSALTIPRLIVQPFIKALQK